MRKAINNKYEEIKDLLLNASPEYIRGESYMFLSKSEVSKLIILIEEICKMKEVELNERSEQII